MQETENGVPNAGLDLRAIREAKGLSLKDIFLATRITTLNLEAIEEDRFHLLPEPVYARTFIKTYAKFLNIDHQPILERYDRYIQSLQAPAVSENDLDKPEGSEHPRPSNNRRFLMRCSVFLLILLIAFSVFYLIFHQDLNILKLSPTPTPQTVTAPVAAPLQTAPAAPADPQPAPSPKEVEPARRYHLVIQATEKTWLRIQEDQKHPQELLLSRGDTLERFASESFALDIGNAGGIEISFQEKSLGKIGKSGQVVHIRLP